MTIKRQALAVVLGGTMLLGTAGVSAAIAPTEKSSVSLTVDAAHTELLSENAVQGDVNGDGYADIADALFIARVDALIVKLAEDMVEAADVNSDGFVDIADSLMIARYDAGLIDGLSGGGKLQDGKFTDNNESFNISDSQIDSFDDISKSIINRVTYNLENIEYGDDKGTADIIVYSPDLKTAFDKALAESKKTMNIDQDDIIEKTDNMLIEYIKKADLKEYKLSVELIKKDGKWSIIVDNELADALTGNIEEVFYSVLENDEEV